MFRVMSWVALLWVCFLGSSPSEAAPFGFGGAEPTVISSTAPEPAKAKYVKPSMNAAEVREMISPLRVYELHREAEGVCLWLRAAMMEFHRLQDQYEDSDQSKGLEKMDVVRQMEAVSRHLNQLDELSHAISLRGGDATEYTLLTRAVRDGLFSGVRSKWWVEFGKEFIRELFTPKSLLTLGVRAIILGLLYLLGRLLSKVAANSMRKALGKVGALSALLQDFLVQMVRRVVWVFIALLGCGVFGVSVTPFITALGALGVVIGLALQDTLINIVSGIVIMVYKPFDVGDWVTISSATGYVTEVNMLSTKIRTFDNQLISTPNSVIWQNQIFNKSAFELRRVDLEVGIAYEEDIEAAKEVFASFLKEHPLTLNDPPPVIEVGTLGPSSVNIVVKPWCKTEDYFDVMFSVTALLKQELDKAGIKIPFPQTEVWFNGRDQLEEPPASEEDRPEASEEAETA